jgi:hypothetical protein
MLSNNKARTPKKDGKSLYVKDALNTAKKKREIGNISGCNEDNKFI